MKAVQLKADWNPVDGYEPDPRDVEGKLSYLGSKVWSNPSLAVIDKPVPDIGPTEVLLKIRACGICGTDVHMVQTKEDGRIMYPGLTGLPTVIGHELSGAVVKVGDRAIDKFTGKRFEIGAPVCAEEMIWCGSCRPCADGYPNHCEALEEIGITIDGAFAEYLKVDARYCWNLSRLEQRYGEEKMYLLGSMVEPTCVAYNAVIERGGGIRPGDVAVICGTGPIGLAAASILKHAGGARVIVSEPNEERAAMAIKLGADLTIDPTKEDFVSRVLEETNQMGCRPLPGGNRSSGHRLAADRKGDMVCSRYQCHRNCGGTSRCENARDR